MPPLASPGGVLRLARQWWSMDYCASVTSQDRWRRMASKANRRAVLKPAVDPAPVTPLAEAGLHRHIPGMKQAGHPLLNRVWYEQENYEDQHWQRQQPALQVGSRNNDYPRDPSEP